MNSRDVVLARIRDALGDAPAPAPVARAYREHGEFAPGAHELLDLLQGRLEDYGATVRRTSGEPAAVGEAVVAALSAHNARTVVIPPGLPPQWCRVGVPDYEGLGWADLDEIDAVVTGAAVAIAETGTIVLDGSPDQGRRAITLIPDLHVCVVARDQVVHLVPEALPRLVPGRPLTFISGPSATSDIELQRVEGVHGPRRLHVVLADTP